MGGNPSRPPRERNKLNPEPPIWKLRRPLTANIESRIDSASNRRDGNRQSIRQSASLAWATELIALDCRYVAELTINRCKCLIDQPERMNSPASQSSSAG